MKKIISMALALGLGISLFAGCGSESRTTENDSAQADTSAAVEAVTESVDNGNLPDGMYVIWIQDAETE